MSGEWKDCPDAEFSDSLKFVGNLVRQTMGGGTKCQVSLR